MRVRHTDLRTNEVIPELQRADRAVGRDDASERDLQRGLQSTAVGRNRKQGLKDVPRVRR